MSFVIFKSNRLEVLLDRLVRVALDSPLSSPFKAEQVVVLTQGMAQWLKLELCRRLGVVANIEFPFPRDFMMNLFGWLLGEKAQPIEPEALTWRIMATVETLLEEPAFRELKHYLSASEDPRRLFQLSERIAGLFDQYSIYRPQWIQSWIEGQETHWQAVLWRAAMTDGLACQGRFLYDLIQVLERPDCGVSRLPERLSVFGAASLPPIYLRVFEALGKHIPVNLFWLSSCREYWGDRPSAKEARRIQARTGDGTVAPEDLHLDPGHPLLVSWGKTGQEFLNIILEASPTGEVDDYQDPGSADLLHFLQSGILNLEDEGNSATAKPKIVKPNDCSVQVHSCHSPLRELQVLRDHLLDWFAADPTLSPHDILVMLPATEVYAPFVKGVFDAAEAGAPAIPYTMADRGARQQSPLMDSFVTLLRLCGTRLTSTAVMGFFQSAVVRRRFDVAEEDLPQIRQWIRNAGIRWGQNAAHREKLGLPPFAEHSWEHGRDRLLLGYAMADGGRVLVNGFLPCEGVEGTSTEVLGRWLDFQQQLFATLDDFFQPRTLAEWAKVLNLAFDRLFLPDQAEETAANYVRQVLDELRQQQIASSYTKEVPLTLVLERVLPRFEQNPSGKAFLRGQVTFAGLSSLRGVPFRVICILGMQDDAFPRRPTPFSFDLMARNPMQGDASRREDDRYLFLETLISARDRLYISYVGQSERDNSPRAPSVVVSELLDYIAARCRLEGAAGEPAEVSRERPIIRQLLVTRHRLHSFSPAYFQPETNLRLFSYSTANAVISRFLADRSRRKSPEPFLTKPLTPPGDDAMTVTLRNLQAFYRNPAKFLVTKRLEFTLPEDDELLADDEPFALDGLDAYQCKQEILEAWVERADSSALMTVWKGSGQLPPNAAGQVLGRGLFDETKPILQRLSAVIGQAKRIQVPVDLAINGFKLEGELTLFEGVGLVHYRPSKVDPKEKPKAHLDLWLEHLAFQLIDGSAPRRSYLVGIDGAFVFREVTEARDMLKGLLDRYWQGQLEPLRFFPRSSFAYALALEQGTKRSPRELALQAWDGNEDFQAGEKDDPYFSLCFKNCPDPLGDPFAVLAHEIVGPLAQHQEKMEANVP